MKISALPRVGLLAGAFVCHVCSAADLTITVTDIEDQRGSLMIALYDSADAYDNGGDAIKGMRVAVEGENTVVTIDDLAAGMYAIKLFHDANDNGKMDKNPVGLPTEGYGFSSNKGRFGPPPFSVAALTVSEDADNATTIKLR